MRCTRRLEIDAGHRLLKHEGKCRHVHGHRYVFEITCTADELDDVGRVIDFGAIKAEVGSWLDEQWDHGFLAEHGDPIVDWLKANEMKHCVLDVPPTAENLARIVRDMAVTLLAPYSIGVYAVRCRETPNCWADA